ncbi:unnamed protein product [Amoebophrya sp. A120]|nr:unnamed protein product [Amoebophrya sp. A120]|eukprot:GSA120T00017292001.1
MDPPVPRRPTTATRATRIPIHNTNGEDRQKESVAGFLPATGTTFPATSTNAPSAIFSSSSTSTSTGAISSSSAISSSIQTTATYGTLRHRFHQPGRQRGSNFEPGGRNAGAGNIATTAAHHIFKSLGSNDEEVLGACYGEGEWRHATDLYYYISQTVIWTFVIDFYVFMVLVRYYLYSFVSSISLPKLSSLFGFWPFVSTSTTVVSSSTTMSSSTTTTPSPNPSCDGDDYLATWLKIGLIGSLPTTILVDNIVRKTTFRTAFVWECFFTMCGIVWYCTGMALVFSYAPPDDDESYAASFRFGANGAGHLVDSGSTSAGQMAQDLSPDLPQDLCQSMLWTTAMGVTALHATSFTLFTTFSLATTLLPSLLKLLLRVLFLGPGEKKSKKGKEEQELADEVDVDELVDQDEELVHQRTLQHDTAGGGGENGEGAAERHFQEKHRRNYSRPGAARGPSAALVDRKTLLRRPPPGKTTHEVGITGSRSRIGGTIATPTPDQHAHHPKIGSRPPTGPIKQPQLRPRTADDGLFGDQTVLFGDQTGATSSGKIMSPGEQGSTMTDETMASTTQQSTRVGSSVGTTTGSGRTPSDPPSSGHQRVSLNGQQPFGFVTVSSSSSRITPDLPRRLFVTAQEDRV